MSLGRQATRSSPKSTMLQHKLTSRKTDFVVLGVLTAVVAAAVLVYAFVPKTATIQLPGDQAPDRTLTYTGLGIRGSGFFGFMPRSIVSSGAGGYDPGVSTLTITPASGGWEWCARAEQGQIRERGLVTASVPIGSGILVPDLRHHLNVSYFYSRDGSMTGSVHEGSGAYDIIQPKFVMHVKVTDGFEKATISKSPDA